MDLRTDAERALALYGNTTSTVVDEAAEQPFRETARQLGASDAAISAFLASAEAILRQQGERSAGSGDTFELIRARAPKELRDYVRLLQQGAELARQRLQRRSAKP